MTGQLKRKSNKRLVAVLAATVIGMFGFGYALVPLYDLFCEITGIGGTPTIADSMMVPNAADIADREVKIEFTSTAASGLPWQIEPADTIKVGIGAMTVAEYQVENAANRNITAQAIPSVTPLEGAKYLVKVECFCFSHQFLKTKEERAMQVAFYVDPDLPEEINTLTLSYSFYEVKQNTGSSG